MDAREAMEMIVQDCECPALNYAVNYAKAGLEMDAKSEEFRVRCLYLVGNIPNWRAGSTSRFSKDEIKEARAAIKRGGLRQRL